MGTPPAGLNASFKALRSAWSAISPERRTYCGAISARSGHESATHLLIQRLVRVRENHRRAADDSTKKYL
jgi:hypothetical protein